MIDTDIACISDVHVQSHWASLYNTISKIKLLRIVYIKVEKLPHGKKIKSTEYTGNPQNGRKNICKPYIR